MTIQPGDDTAAGNAGRGHLRASHADREHVIGTLQAAFVAGMLAKDELDLRVSQAFASRTYADLAAVTADLPARLAVTQPAKAARTPDQFMQRPVRMMAVATALYAGVWAFTFLPPWPANPEGDPPHAVAVLFFLSAPAYLCALLIGVVNVVVLWQEKRSGGQPPRRPARGAGGHASRRPPTAGPGGQLPPGDPGHAHTTEAAPVRHPGPLFSRWRPPVSLPSAR